VTYNDVSAFEVSGTNYTAGGWVLTGGSSAYSGSDAVLDAADATSGTGTTISDVAYAVIYDTATGNKIRDIKPVSPVASVTSGTFILKWSASGILKFVSV
jgi:hypothetical protein